MNSSPLLYLTLTALLGLAGFWALFGGTRCGAKTRRWWIVVLGIGVAARLFALFAISPSDDVNRYLWEGKIVASGRSPYVAPASDEAWKNDHDQWWSGINHLTETTVYPPLTQILGAALTAIWESPLSFKVFALLCDVGIAWLLLRHWGQSGTSQAHLAAFWIVNPVPVISFAGEGHFDAAMVLCAVAALAAAQNRRWPLSWAMLGLAISIKWLALVMLPLWLWRSRGRGVWMLLPPMVLPALPFLSSLDDLVLALLHFGTAFGSNNPVHYLLTSLSGSRPAASAACAALLGGWAWWVLHGSRRGESVSKPVSQLWSGLVLLLPTVTYWYAAWLLPFAAVTRSKPWWIFSLTSIFYYTAAWHAQSSGDWHHPAWAITLTWLPLYAALSAPWFMSRLTPKKSRPPEY